MRDAQRILRELRKARAENTDELWLDVQGDNVHHWVGMIKAPAGTPFEGHYFQVAIDLRDSYPMKPPKAKFITPIFHPNIHFKKGKICLDILKSKWSPAWGMQTLGQAISMLLSEPASDSPLNTLAGNLIRCNDHVGYFSMASMYARKFAPTTNVLMAAAQNAQKKT
jgi:peroxin-4